MRGVFKGSKRVLSGFCDEGFSSLGWALPPLCNSWVMLITQIAYSPYYDPHYKLLQGGGSTQGLGVGSLVLSREWGNALLEAIIGLNRGFRF